MSLELTVGASLLAGATLTIPAFRWGMREGRLDVLNDPDEFLDGVSDE
ncbi:hypothetical protein [Salinigranum sp. GCM10025319]